VPTSTAVTVRRATPMIGRRRLEVNMAAMKNAAHIRAAAARIDRVGRTAWSRV
jgi:hypothetical protein